MKLELTDVAQSLNLPVNTVERWIRQGRIPVRKTGTLCIFKKAVLEKWAIKHDINFNLPAKETLAETDESGNENNDSDSLVAALKRGGVHPLSATDMYEIFKDATKVFTDFSESEQETLYNKLVEREKLTSTGIGKGVAIPHPRTPMTGENSLPVIATFFLKNSIDFNAIDDRPVNILFVIVCPSVQTHLHLLSRISFCVRDDDFVRFLNTSPEPETFFKKVGELEHYMEKNR